MKKTIVRTLVLAAALTLPSLPMDAKGQPPGGPPGGPGPGFEEKRAEMLRHIEEKIARNHQEKACVQAARGFDDLRACRDRYVPPQDPSLQGGMRRNEGSKRPNVSY